MSRASWSGAFLRGEQHPPLRTDPDAPLDACFLDRDGTLNILRPGYRTVADFVLIDGAVEAVARLNAAGVPVVLVTNQQGLGTGQLTWDELEDVHRVLVQRLEAVGGHLDDIRVCPHRAGTCGCRKPLPGLLQACLTDNPHLVPGRCLMVGDAESDSVAAHAVGIRSQRVGGRHSLRSVVSSILE